MLAATGLSSPYWHLVTTDPTKADPSDMLNLVDAVRQTLPLLDDDDAERAEAKCRSVELDIHLTFTPPTLALACCE